MTQPTERRLTRVIDHIHDNPGGDLSLDALADVAAMSRFHWHRIWRATLGETVAQTVRRMRMYRAALMLVQTDATLPRIAMAVGYPNPASFARTFADSYGATPAAFRAAGVAPHRPTHHTERPTLMYPVTIRTDPARRLIAVPHTGSYMQINRSFEKLYATLGPRGLMAQTGLMIGVYYDDPSTTPEASLRAHAGVESPTAPAAAPLEQVTLPAARHAVLTYTGPYSGLPVAYDQLYGTWLPASGETPADSPPFEVYRNSPMDTAPDRLITEICLPLVG